MLSVYLIAFVFGLGFAVVSGILSGIFGGVDGGGDVGGAADVDAGAAHAGGHAGSSVHFPVLSPVTISTFIASFGGIGAIGIKVFEWPLAVHLPVALGSAFGLAAAVFYLFYKLFGQPEGPGSHRLEEIVGGTGEVTIKIPAHGAGQIAYSHNGMRYTAVARSDKGEEIPQGTTVRINRVVAGTLYVTKA